MIGGLFSLGGLRDILQKPLNSVDNAVNKAGDVCLISFNETQFA